jgi:hypothetical protein
VKVCGGVGRFVLLVMVCPRWNATGALSFPNISVLQSVPLHVLCIIEVVESIEVIVRIFGSKVEWLKT